MYIICSSPYADKFLAKAKPDLKERILNKINVLTEMSVPLDAKFIGRNEGDKMFRIRMFSRNLFKPISFLYS